MSATKEKKKPKRYRFFVLNEGGSGMSFVDEYEERGATRDAPVIEFMFAPWGVYKCGDDRIISTPWNDVAPTRSVVGARRRIRLVP